MYVYSAGLSASVAALDSCCSALFTFSGADSLFPSDGASTLSSFAPFSVASGSWKAIHTGYKCKGSVNRRPDFNETVLYTVMCKLK